MRTIFVAVSAAAFLWPAAALCDTLSLKITDPKDGYEARYDASWRRPPAAAERYWLCNRPLWVPSGVGRKISRYHQHGYRIELVAGAGERAICTLDGPEEGGTRSAQAD